MISPPHNLIGNTMTKRIRPNFTPEFRLESAQLVLDQDYSVKEAAEAMNVGKSMMNKRVRQLKDERGGIMPQWNDFLEALKQSGCQRLVIAHRMKLKWRSLNILYDITTKSDPINIMVA